MSGFEQRFHTAIMEYMAREHDIDDVTEIVEVEQDNYTDGGSCPTCQFTVIVVEVTYHSATKRYLTWRYRGDFGAFLREL